MHLLNVKYNRPLILKSRHIPPLEGLAKEIYKIRETRSDFDPSLPKERVQGEFYLTSVIDDIEWVNAIGDSVHDLSNAYSKGFHEIDDEENSPLVHKIIEEHPEIFTHDAETLMIKEHVDGFKNCMILHFNQCLTRESKRFPMNKELIDRRLQEHQERLFKTEYGIFKNDLKEEKLVQVLLIEYVKTPDFPNNLYRYTILNDHDGEKREGFVWLENTHGSCYVFKLYAEYLNSPNGSFDPLRLLRRMDALARPQPKDIKTSSILEKS